MKFTFSPFEKDAELADIYPTPGIKHLPEWFKNLKVGLDGSNKYRLENGDIFATVKACLPFMDAMTAGYMVTLVEDVEVSWQDDRPVFKWRTNRKIISTHVIEQTYGIGVPEGFFPQIIKFESEVVITTPKNYSAFFMHPANRYDLPFMTVSGFVETDTYNMPVKFPFFIQKNWEGIIEKGTPVVQIIPIKREKWEHQIEPFDQNKTRKAFLNFYSKINRSYKSQFWVRKDYS